jgi:hypothetical protein
MEEMHLVQWLRRIQQAWELDLLTFARISHLSEATLKEFFALSAKELALLPTIPEKLSAAVPLVSLFKRIQEVYPDPKAQNEWLKNPNSVLEGQVPVDVIALSPEHLSYVSYVVESGISQTRV